MSEERFDQIENQMNQMQSMMEQLIKMVGSNNTVSEKLRQEVNEIRSTMATKEDLVEIKSAAMATKEELAEIKSSMATKEDIARLERLANGTMDIVESVYREVEKNGSAIDILAGKWIRQEAEIQVLKKAR